MQDFSALLLDCDHGKVNERLGEQLQKLVEAVNVTGKNGSISIKVTVSKEGPMVQVDVGSSVKTPQPRMMGTLFHIGKDSLLTRDNPKQMILKDLAREAPPRVVPDAKTVATGEREEG